MTYEASATKERYEELKKSPILFCKQDSKTEFCSRIPFIFEGWFSCDPTISFFASKEELNCDEKYILFIVGEQTNLLNRSKERIEKDNIIFNKTGMIRPDIDKNKRNEEFVFFKLNKLNILNYFHWICIFNDCYYNFKANNNRYACMSLAWAIYTKSWDINVINKALSHSSADIQHVIANQINNTLYLYSLDKQEALISIISNTISNATPKIIPVVENALKEIAPSSSFTGLGLYSKIDYIVTFGTNKEEKKYLCELYNTSRNLFIHYKYWKDNIGQKFYDYSSLLDIYSYVDTDEQLQIIRRYLHDVRMNVTNVDENILLGFRDYKYPSCVDGRNFVTSPGTNLLMTAPIFSDAIITLRRTNGERLQTFNGILDLAIKNSNQAYPHIDFGIRKILPYCDGGLIPNKEFQGFIHYNVHYSLNESLLTEENLYSTAIYILDNYASRQKHWCCTIDEDRTLSDLEKSKCENLYTEYKVRENKDGNIQGTYKGKVKCEYLEYNDNSPKRWIKIGQENDKFLRLCIDNADNTKDIITSTDISLTLLDTNIRKWAAYYKDIVYHNNNQPSDFENNELAKHVIRNYYTQTKVDIYPYKSIFYSSKKSLFNLWTEEDQSNNSEEKERDRMAQSRESKFIFEKTLSALKAICPESEIADDHVTIPYEESILKKILSFCFYKDHVYKSSEDFENKSINYSKFLVARKYYKIRYCTPKYSDKRDNVSGLPFFWCGSEECFCNVLENQALQKQKDWQTYTLYHAAEIIGHKLIYESPEGNTTSNIVNNFAAEIRQAEKMYARLVCRGCGHMIFSKRGSILNGSRFFNCLNPQCKQYGIEVYLSRCNTCKSGLIDSRDSERCSNNWVICPNCLSCCNDRLFESLYQKHFRNLGNNHLIPRMIEENLGRGHNNRYQFFCYKCGSPLEYTSIKEQVVENGEVFENESAIRGCKKCEISLEEQLKKYSEATNNKAVLNIIPTTSKENDL